MDSRPTARAHSALGECLKLEHITLTGQTVFDGPELIWTQDFHEVGAVSTDDGYKTRRYETFPRFRNVDMDMYRKIIDGTIRIMTRDEVIERCKYAIVHDVQSA